MFIEDVSESPHFRELLNTLRLFIAEDPHVSRVLAHSPIIVGAHRPTAGFNRRRLPGSILLNLEQIGHSSLWSDADLITLLAQARFVVDYSQENCDLLRDNFGIEAFLLCSPPLKPERDLRPLEDRPIDLCFVGASSPRRDIIRDLVEETFDNVVWLNDCFGDARDNILRNSKIVLNVRYSESGLFETTRAELAMSKGCLVLSERPDDYSFVADSFSAVHFCEYVELISNARRLLDDIRSGRIGTQPYLQQLNARYHERRQIVTAQLRAIADAVETGGSNPGPAKEWTPSQRTAIVRHSIDDLFFSEVLEPSETKSTDRSLLEAEQAPAGHLVPMLSRLVSHISDHIPVTPNRRTYTAILLAFRAQRLGYERCATILLSYVTADAEWLSIKLSSSTLKQIARMCVKSNAVLRFASPLLQKMSENHHVDSDVVLSLRHRLLSGQLSREALRLLSEKLVSSGGGAALALGSLIDWHIERNLASVLKMYEFAAWVENDDVRGALELIIEGAKRERAFGIGVLGKLLKCRLSYLDEDKRFARSDLIRFNPVTPGLIKCLEAFGAELNNARTLMSGVGSLPSLLDRLGVALSSNDDLKCDAKILTILACYNERDCVRSVIADLKRKGSEIIVIDNWSDDGSYELLRDYERCGDIRLVRYPDQKVDYYDWEGILKCKERLALEYPGYWISHQDMDELRDPPFDFADLHSFAGYAELGGYNVIDFAVVNFEFVDNGFTEFDDLRSYFNHFRVSTDIFNSKQQKMWLQGRERVDLATAGGHEVNFLGRRLFPLKGVLRHYPKRSADQARRKIFAERKNRFRADERDRGWHVQYDGFQLETDVMPADWKSLIDKRVLEQNDFSAVLTLGRNALQNGEWFSADR